MKKQTITIEISPNYINLINSKDKNWLEKELQSINNIIKYHIDSWNNKVLIELKAKKDLIEKQIAKLNYKKFWIQNFSNKVFSIIT